MSIIKNNKLITNISIDNKNISQIYFGNKLVYEKQPITATVIYRDIDEFGTLSLPQGNLDNLFDNITSIDSYGLAYAFFDCPNLTGSVSFPLLTNIGDYGIHRMCEFCSGLTGSVSFPLLTNIGNWALARAFYGCTGLTSVSFPSLHTVNENGLGYTFNACTNLSGAIEFPNLVEIGYNGLNNTFTSTSITSVSLPNLETVQDFGLYYAFSQSDLTGRIDFPKLVNVYPNSFLYTFLFCGNITEIHFRTDMQNTIEQLNYYSNKFGASNATIYFDL